MKQGSSKLVQFKDVADHFDVSVQTVRSWVRENKIPFVKIGSVYRFNIIQIEHAVVTPPQITASENHNVGDDEENDEQSTEKELDSQIGRLSLLHLLWVKRPNLRRQIFELIEKRPFKQRISVHLATGIPLRLSVENIAKLFDVKKKEMREILASQHILLHPINFSVELSNALHEELDKVADDEDYI